MDAKGGSLNSADGQVLHWPGRLLSAEDLRQALNGHRELVLPARTIITPLAADELRRCGVRITRQAVEKQQARAASWGYAQDRPQTVVQSAVKSLERDGIPLKELQLPAESSACRWAAALARCVAQGDCTTGVVFCQDAGLVCCVANKLAGLRAVVVHSVAQAARAALSLGANLVAVEMPGRTFFEVRQILRTLCVPGMPSCPPGVACVLQELDGHAHR
jgi:ribose 5-phosphate isomerase RpiB